jgi:hypothetical protein
MKNETNGGNVWFADLEPIEISTLETMLIYTALAIGVLAGLALIFMVAGWAYGALQ